MKKIIYLFDEDDKYGAPKAGLEMIMELKNNGIYPIVLTSKKNGVNVFCDKNNIENYVTYHHKYTYVNTNSILKDTIKFIPRFIRYKIGNIKALYIIKNKIDLKDIELIHSNISAIDLGILISKKYNLKNVMHIREFGELDFNMKSYRRNYIKFLNKNVNKFIAISDAIKNYWMEKGIDTEKIQTIYDGVYTEDILRKEDYTNTGKLKILMIGSIGKGKGQVELVKSINLLDENIKKNIIVDIIGSGYKHAEEQLNNEINNNNLSKIISFKNYDPLIRKKIKDYDVGINCSISEGFGRVTIEYMSAGLCVIASNAGANKELIIDGTSGFLYEKGNHKDLSNKITYIFKNYDEIKNIASNSQKIVYSKFTIKINAEKVNQLYLNL